MEQSSPARAGPAGGIGEMTTPELLAKREQRRRMEAQAAALARPGLSRRLLQPTQTNPHQHQQQGQQQQPSSVSGVASQSSGRSMFSRVGFKRSAPAATPAPPPQEGVSAEDLLKLMEDEPAAEAGSPGGSCSKRPKVSVLLQQQQGQQQQQQPQQQAHGVGGLPAVRVGLLTLQQQDRVASVSAAFDRVAAQRQQQQEQEQQQQQAEAQGLEAQPLPAALHASTGTTAGPHTQQGASAVQSQQQQQQTGPDKDTSHAAEQDYSKPAAAPHASAAATAAPAAATMQPSNADKRWLYVKPGTQAADKQQQQQQQQAEAAAPTSTRKQAAAKGAAAGRGPQAGTKKRAAPARRAAGRDSRAAQAPEAPAEEDAAAAEADTAAATAARRASRQRVAAAGRGSTSKKDPAAAAAAEPGCDGVADAGRSQRPRRQAAAAAASALARQAAASTAEQGEEDAGAALQLHKEEHGSSSSSDSSSGSDACSSDDEHAPAAQAPQSRRSRSRGGLAAAGGRSRAKGAAAVGNQVAAAAGRGKTGCRRPRGAAARGGDGTAKESASKVGQQAAAGSSERLSKQMRQLEAAVSNSRRAQQLSAALTEGVTNAQPEQPKRKQQQRVAQQPGSRLQSKSGGAGASGVQAPAATATGAAQSSAHQALPSDLAAKVQAALAAKSVAGTASAAGGATQGGGGSAAAAADDAECVSADADMMLLDELDELEIIPTTAAGPTVQQQEQQQGLKQQQPPPAAAAAACAPPAGASTGCEGDAAEPGDMEQGVSDDGAAGSSDWEVSEDGSGAASGYDSEAASQDGDVDGSSEQDDGSGSSSSDDAGDDDGTGSDGGEDSDGAEDVAAPAGRRQAAKRAAAGSSRAKGSRAARSKAAAAAGGDDELEPDGDPKPKKAKRPRAAAAGGAAAGGGVAKRTSRKASAGAAASSKPKGRKPAQRQNFRRHRTAAGGYGFKFLSKAAVKGGPKRFRRVINGKLVCARRRAPHMAGQGAEYLEGFAGSGAAGGKGRCFRCGQAGHWEDACPLLAARIAEQEAELAAWMKDGPDAEESQRIAGGNGYHASAAAAAAAGAGAGDGQQQQEEVLSPEAAAAAAAEAARRKLLQQGKQPRQPPLTQAQLCELAGLPVDAPWQPAQLTDEQLASVLKGVWGHSGFRGQQLPLIRAALQGTSMLGVLPTGLGKSLTYQLPALLLQGLVVVVSPLLSLMHDQVSRLPPCLPGAMLQGNMTKDEVQEVLADAEAGKLRLLYLAPEKLATYVVCSSLRRVPNLPLVVVDEAHCMSEWGEGFRPAYFRLGHRLTKVLQPPAVLALTATAAPATRAGILQLLSIPASNQIVASPLRDNLRLRVMHVTQGASKAGAVANHVVQLLKTGELSSVKSAVVYAGMRYSTDALAAQLSRAGISAAAYHAGLKYEQRKLVQDAFLRGRVRVMVATVAFGMGLDKPDLEAVLHTSMPSSLEDYVQQVGRAGRDGRTATCTVFLDDQEYLRYRALRHQRVAKRQSIERLLRRVFNREEREDSPAAAAAAEASAQPAARRKGSKTVVQSQHRVLAVSALCSELDLHQEVLESTLSFLQEDPVEPYLEVLPAVAATLDVRFHNTPPEVLAKKHPVVEAILKAKTRKYAGTYKVHLAALLPVYDIPPGDIVKQLSDLAAAKELGMDTGNNQAMAWRLVRQPEDWEGLVDALYTRLDKVVTASVERLDRSYEALAGAAIYSSSGSAQETHLRRIIEDYFMEDSLQQQLHQQEPADAAAAEAEAAAAAGDAEAAEGAHVLPWGAKHPVRRASRESLSRQLRAVLHTVAARARDLGPARFDGLVLARLVAGINSPGLADDFWKGCREKGCMQEHDFRLVAAAAEQVVQEFWEAEDRSRGVRTMG